MTISGYRTKVFGSGSGALFYADPGACAGYDDFIAGKSMRAFKYWKKGSAGDKICEARVGGQPLDFAHLPSELDSCERAALPASVGAFPAPVQSVSLVTGLLSTETVLSAQALYFIYGFGPSGQVSPWTDGSGSATASETCESDADCSANAPAATSAFMRLTARPLPPKAEPA